MKLNGCIPSERRRELKSIATCLLNQVIFSGTYVASEDCSKRGAYSNLVRIHSIAGKPGRNTHTTEQDLITLMIIG